MDNFKRNYLKRTLSLVLAVIMIITLVPLGAFTALAEPADQPAADATSSATYYKKANWENRIKDKSRWPIGDNQRLVRVSTSDPVEMNDIDYDGNFVDANGRTVLRLVYKEKGAAATAVWYRALFNFGELDQFIDYDLSYLVGANDDAKIVLTPFNDREERMVDIGVARGLLTQQRKNLPINLVLKEGVTINTLGKKNYIVQMRLTDKNGVRVYSYAPKGTAMDYSTYTKTTSVSLEDKVNRLFIKGGLQNDGNDATNQEFFMSEFIANPEQYDDGSNLGIIRTQYMGQRSGTKQSPTVGGEPIAFTQAFDAKLLDYLKPDGKGNVAYVNVLENSRLKSKWSHDFGFKIKDFNKSADGKLAYLVIAPNAFQKDGVNKVEIEKHDQFTMIQGFYITAIDYVVDKAKFEDTFAGKTAGIDATRKLNYSTISGWTNPNKDGWVIFERDFADGYVANEGESYIIDTTTDPQGGQIMIKIGNDDAIIRRTQGYYTGSVLGNAGIEKIAKFTDGIYTFDLREGATVSAGDKLKVYMPYTKEHAGPVNFLEIHNGTKLNKGAATLKLLTNRKINMHLYKEGNKGHYVLKYTLADGTESSKKFEPKLTWKYDNKDKVMTGAANGATLSTGGNFYIDTEKLQPGADIFVESYDEKGNEIPEQKSWFKYKPIAQSTERVEGLTWTDHSDTSSILSVNKSLYTPYQVLFTNDYAEGTDDFYKDPRVLPDDNAKFNTDTIEFVGYTKYDGGKVRTIYDEGRTPKLIAKVQADEDEYNDKGELTKESAKKIMIPKEEIFDPNFNETSKEYTAYEYKVNLAKMLEYNSADKTDKSLTLLKDMKFVSNASDGSSLPSDYYETRVRARVLFDTTDGEFADKTKKAVKIVPDNIKFYGEDGYAANGFEGANVEANTGDKFPEAPKLEGKNFLGWVTEAGKTALGDKAVVTADAFNGLPKDQIFTNETPVTKHLVVYAVYSDEVTVTFDANEGKFGDGKDTTNVKVEGGNATAPTDPTRDGYEFKGWADKKDATEADADILKNVNAPKTVYAVWEKTEKTPLELTAPTPVEVKDLKGLTSDEIDKVKKAVVEANKDKGITEADVTVAEDGTVTVTKDGKTGTLTPDKTIKQKEVQNEFNPPKEPVPVDKIGQLTDEEIGKIKQAVKDANPDRNFKDDEITVEADGTVKINQGGKVGTILADKTVVQKDTILELQAPEKTEVKDITNLTKEERDKVAAAVKTKNNLPNTATIDVDSKGNVTVTDGTKTGKLKAKDTVKPFTREDKPLNQPVQKVKVSDKTNLTEKEKQDVRDAIKAANPDLDFKDNEIQVDEDGTVTVPMGETKVGTIPGTATVEEITDADKTIKLLEPEKTVVADKTKLTPQEKTAVKEAVKKANPTLNLTNDEIEVAEDGSVTVTRGEDENQKVGQLSQEDTVVENLKKPEATALRDGSVVVTPKDDRTEELEITFGDAANPTTVTAKKENGKWILPAGTDPSIMIDETTGMVTIPAKMLKNNDEVKAKAKAGKLESEEATVNSNDETVPAAPTVVAEDDGSVKVTPPADADTKTVEIKYTDKDGHAQTLVATKENGKWTLPAGTDASITIDETTGVVALPKDKVKAGEKVTATAKDANNNVSKAGEATPVDKTELKTEVAKETETKDSDKYKNADETKKKAYDKALKDAQDVINNPKATQEDVNKALEALKKAEKDLDGKTEEKPTITNGKAENDPSKTTTTVSGKTKPNTEVTIKLADGTETKVTSDADGKFTAEVTKQNKDAQITITPKDGTASTVTVTEKAAEEKPTITEGKAENDPSKTTTTVSGKTKPNTEVTIKLADGTETKVTSDADGKFTAEVTKQNKDAQITITPKDGTASIVTVTEKAAEEKPTITEGKAENDPSKTTTTVSGKTKPNTEVTIKLADGTETKVTSDADGKFTAEVTKQNKDAQITITPKDGTASTVTVTEKAAEEKPTITEGKAENDPSKTTTTVSGKTKPNTEVTIKLADGTETKVTSDADGKFTAEVTKQNKDAQITITPKDGTASTVTVTEKAAEEKPTITEGKAENDPSKTTTTVSGKTKPNTEVTIKLADGTETKVTSDADGKFTAEVTKQNKDAQITITPKDGTASTVTVTEKAAEEKPVAPTVKAKDDGSVTVTPPENAKEVSVTYTPEGAKDPVTVTATKGDDGNWTLPEGLDVTINPGTGVITIPADKVKDGTEVSAVAKDASGTASEETNDSKATAKTPRPDYADIYYPDTTIGVGDERKIYPSGYPGYVSTLPEGIYAPRGVYVRVNHDGSIDVEVSPRYTGPSMFTITGYLDVDGKIAPISIRIRVIDDVRSDRRRQRMDKRDEMDKEDELIDTREVLTHKAYIFGYPDGTVRPNGFITRAEAAAMLSRLLNEENTSSSAKPAFIDTPSKWYNNAINAVVARGIMRGYSDGRFKPNAPITRAEFAQMISAIDAKPFGTAPFADVKGHWAELAIGKEYAAGRISGYPNGTFRPDAPITRAEAAHILNKIFERNYDLVSALQSNDKGNIKFFTDLSTSFWGYNDMVEATNTHTFRRRVKGMVQEDWSEINR